MPDPTPPAQPTIPNFNFRDREKYPTRPANVRQAYADDFNVLVKELSRREGPPEIAPRPLCDPALSQREYERRYLDLRRTLARSQR